MDFLDFFVKNTKTQIRRKASGFVNTNPKKIKNLYILLGFINITWISKSIKIYKPITPKYCGVYECFVPSPNCIARAWRRAEIS